MAMIKCPVHVAGKECGYEWDNKPRLKNSIFSCCPRCRRIFSRSKGIKNYKENAELPVSKP